VKGRKRTPGLTVFRRLDFQLLAAAFVAVFLVFADVPWWTVTGVGSNQLFTVRVSPFYSQTILTGLPSNVPFAWIFGLFTRSFLALGAIGLIAVAVWPLAWWRSLVESLSLVSLTELYLSFLLMQLRAMSKILAAYGVTPPLYGTGQLTTNIIGLDLNLYHDPIIRTEYGLPFYLGLITIVLVVGSISLRSLQAKNIPKKKGVESIFTGDTEPS
jgi:hypothetical protein